MSDDATVMDLDLDLGESVDIDLGLESIDVTADQATTITRISSPLVATNPVVFPPALKIPNRGQLVFDIEAIPDLDRRHLFGLDAPVEKKPEADPIIGNWPDFMGKTLTQIEEIVMSVNPTEEWLKAFEAWENQSKKPRSGIAKLAKQIREARDPGGPEAEIKKIKEMSTTPEMLRIIAIGIGWRDVSVGVGAAPVDIIQGYVVDDSKDESDLLDWFWDSVKNVASVIGYNVLNYDIPALLTRSKILGVTPSRSFSNKPWDNDVIDLMVRRWPKGGQMKLKPLLEAIGVKVPYPDCDGSKVFDMWNSDKRHEIADYVKSDVYGELQLAEFWRGLFW